MVRLAGLVVARGVRPPYTWSPEFVTQFRFVLRAAFIPMIISAFAMSFGPVGVQASGLFEIFGSLDRLGAVYQITVVRYFSPIVVGIILAGTAGTAMCADLGARVVRDEVSALQVMAVEPIRSLVVPRVAAMIALAGLFNIVVMLAGFAGALAVLSQHHAEFGPFLSVFFANGTAIDLPMSMLKAVVFGTVIAVVSAYKGMNVSGGPEAVGRAVNQTVVTSFLAIGFLDYVFSQFILATNPILSQVRG
jgi:phospholipid/cholesterol/gamma-HCH transport system permease protein